MPELSRRPYLLRAMLDWIVDCGYTPHLIVDATPDAVQVPRQFVKEGRIVLNISASATQSFQIGAAAVEFNARFSGVSHRIRVPVEYVLGIYARETGQGMVFTEEPGTVSAEAGTGTRNNTNTNSSTSTSNSSNGTGTGEGGSDENPPEPPPTPDRPKRPSLKVVK